MTGKVWNGDSHEYELQKKRWRGLMGANERRVTQRRDSYAQTEAANLAARRERNKKLLTERWLAANEGEREQIMDEELARYGMDRPEDEFGWECLRRRVQALTLSSPCPSPILIQHTRTAQTGNAESQSARSRRRASRGLTFASFLIATCVLRGVGFRM